MAEGVQQGPVLVGTFFNTVAQVQPVKFGGCTQ